MRGASVCGGLVCAGGYCVRGASVCGGLVCVGG